MSRLVWQASVYLNEDPTPYSTPVLRNYEGAMARSVFEYLWKSTTSSPRTPGLLRSHSIDSQTTNDPLPQSLPHIYWIMDGSYHIPTLGASKTQPHSMRTMTTPSIPVSTSQWQCDSQTAIRRPPQNYRHMKRTLTMHQGTSEGVRRYPCRLGSRMVRKDLHNLRTCIASLQNPHGGEGCSLLIPRLPEEIHPRRQHEATP